MERVYVYDKYISTLDTVKDMLDKYGIAILPSLLNDIEIKAMNDGIWNYLEYASSNLNMPIDRTKPKTWKTYEEYFTEKSMLLQKYGIGQAQHLWNLRQNPKVINVFAKIYDTNELSVSFDGTSFGLPPEKTKLKPLKSKWFHTDQSYYRNDFEAIQSWITGYEVCEGDATLGFLESSHKFHLAVKNKFKIDEDDRYYEDFFELSKPQINYYKNVLGCCEYYVKCPVGSMVLWDSRTIHYGASPHEHRTNPNFRNVAYICMQPKKYITLDVKRQRKKAFDDIKTTSHWVTKCSIFRDCPREMINIKEKILKPKTPVLTDLGRSLI